MTIGERVKARREELRIEVANLARAVGIAPSTLYDLERGDSKSSRHLHRIATGLLTTPEYLETGKGRKDVQPRPVRAYDVEAVEGEEGFDPDQEALVPVVDVHAGASKSGRAVPEFVETKHRHRYSLRFFRETNSKPSDVRIMIVEGDSMVSTLFDGDKIAVDFGKTERIVNGGVHVIVVNGDEVRVKRLFRMTDGRIRIVSDNQDKQAYPDEFAQFGQEGFALLGKVIERKGTKGL